MLIDSSEFPLVWMRRDTPSNENSPAAFDQFAMLLMRRQAFVFLSADGFDGGEHEHTQEERKQISLWMKKNKAEIRAFVRGMVLIEPSAAKRLASKAFAAMFGKFWGYPMMIAASKDEALEVAHRLLNGRQEASQAT